MPFVRISKAGRIWNPGSGLPTITSEGVLLTDPQWVQVQAILEAGNYNFDVVEAVAGAPTPQDPNAFISRKEALRMVREASRWKWGNSLVPLTRRTKVDASDLASVNTGLAIGHADVQAVAGANGNVFQMPAVIDTPIPANCPIDFGVATQRVWAANFSSTLNPMPFMVNTWRFMCNDDMVVLYCGGPGAGQIFIDGVLAGEYDTLFVASTWTSIKFPSKRARLIEIRTSHSFNAIYWRKAYNVWKPAPVGGPRLLAVGDSYFAPSIYTDGANAFDKAFRGWWQQIGPLVGIQDVLVDGIGSTGYIKESGAGALNNFNQRFELRHKPFNPDVLCITGGTNDVYIGETTENIVAAIKSYFSKAREAWPYAKLVMFEGVKPPTAWPADAIARYQAISAALLADPLMKEIGFYVVNTTDPAWLTGTGYGGAPNLSGNTDVVIGHDGVHYTVTGARYLAHRAAQKLAPILADDGTLLNTKV